MKAPSHDTLSPNYCRLPAANSLEMSNSTGTPLDIPCALHANLVRGLWSGPGNNGVDINIAES